MKSDSNMTARALGEELTESPTIGHSEEIAAEMVAIRDLGENLRSAFRLEQNHHFDLGESRKRALEAIALSARPGRPLTFLRTAGWVSLGAAATVALGFFVRVDSPQGSTPLAEAVYDPFFALEALERATPLITENPLREMRGPGIETPFEPQSPMRHAQIADFRLADSAFTLRNVRPLPDSPMLQEFTQNTENSTSLILADLEDIRAGLPVLGAAGENFRFRTTNQSTTQWNDPIITPIVKLNISRNNVASNARAFSVSQLISEDIHSNVNSSITVDYSYNLSEGVETVKIWVAPNDSQVYMLEMNPRIVQSYQMDSHSILSDQSHEITVNFVRRSSEPRRLESPELRYQLHSARLTRAARSSEIGCLSLVDSRNQIVQNIPLGLPPAD